MAGIVSAHTLAQHYKSALERIVFVHSESGGGISADELAEIAGDALDVLPEPPKPHWSRDPNANPPTKTSVFKHGQWIDEAAPCLCGSGGYPSPCPKHDPGRIGS